MPDVFVRRGIATPEGPTLTKMPAGTGAVPVSSGPVRGAVLGGMHEAF